MMRRCCHFEIPSWNPYSGDLQLPVLCEAVLMFAKWEQTAWVHLISSFSGIPVVQTKTNTWTILMLLQKTTRFLTGLSTSSLSAGVMLRHFLLKWIRYICCLTPFIYRAFLKCPDFFVPDLAMEEIRMKL